MPYGKTTLFRMCKGDNSATAVAELSPLHIMEHKSCCHILREIISALQLLYTTLVHMCYTRVAMLIIFLQGR